MPESVSRRSSSTAEAYRAAVDGRGPARATSRAGPPPLVALQPVRIDVLVQPALRETGVAHQWLRVRRCVDIVRHVGAGLVPVEPVVVVVRAGLPRVASCN